MIARLKNDLKNYLGYTLVSAQSQLRSEVVNSYLNWLWWVLEPLCFMMIYVFIFGYVFKANEPFFPIFVFVGITIWDFFSRTMNVSVKLLRNNKAIISKVYLPKYVLLLTKIWVNGFKMMVSFVIVFVMMLLFRVPITLNLLWIIPVLTILVVLSFGIGMILMHFGVFLDDLSNVVSILLRALFYMTGVFYNVSGRIAEPYGRILSKINPIAFLIETARNTMLYNYNPEIIVMVGWLLVSITIMMIGIRLIYKNENSYVKVL